MVWINTAWANNAIEGTDFKIGLYFMDNRELMKVLSIGIIFRYLLWTEAGSLGCNNVGDVYWDLVSVMRLQRRDINRIWQLTNFGKEKKRNDLMTIMSIQTGS